MKEILDTTDSNPAQSVVTYRVTVTKVTTNVVFRDREYKKFSDDEEDEKYGYVYFDNTKDVETVAYKQELDEIDLPEVIKAVNGMSD
jgi:hypothetical protein